MKLVIDVPGACEALGIKKSLLYKKLAAGELTRVKCGRRTLITVQSIEAFVASHQVQG